jgi:hypothetical protein
MMMTDDGSHSRSLIEKHRTFGLQKAIQIYGVFRSVNQEKTDNENARKRDGECVSTKHLMQDIVLLLGLEVCFLKQFRPRVIQLKDSKLGMKPESNADGRSAEVFGVNKSFLILFLD